MTIEEIFNQPNQSDIIEGLKKRVTNEPDISTFKREWDIDLHDINDAAVRPDKVVITTDSEGKATGTRVEKVARIAVALQKLIVGRAAAFAFGNEPKISVEDPDENQKLVYDACMKILADIKSISHNKRIAKDMMRFTEAAECWFARPDAHEKYGFKSAFKIKCRIFSAESGDTLYPLFDEYGDMIAFSRAYTVKGDTEKNYFETYTNTKIIKWEQQDSEWVEVSNVANVLGKIPIVYIRQPETEWSDAQNLIDEFEKLLSRFSDTVAYHGSPKIFTTGIIKGFAKKGEEGALIEGGEKATAKYLAWEFAPEAVQLEIDTLLRLIYSITQTPDISFDAIKGINQISGIALRLMFLDAHLKVEDKKEIYLDMLHRRMNILKAFVGKINTKLAEASNATDFEIDIDPYMPGDLAGDINNYTNATGGKAILSQRTAIAKSGMVKDVEAELKLIQDENAASNVQDIFGTAV